MLSALRSAGHSLTLDWTSLPHIRPYSTNFDEARRIAELEATAVTEADALILLADERGVGLFVELGIAIGQGKRVYVLTSSAEQTIFYYHPKVKVFSSREELFAQLATDHSDDKE